MARRGPPVADAACHDPGRRRQPGEPAGAACATLHGTGHRMLAAQGRPHGARDRAADAAGSGAARRDDAGHRRLRGVPGDQGAIRRPQDTIGDFPVGARRGLRQGGGPERWAPWTTSPSRFRPRKCGPRVESPAPGSRCERELRRSRDDLDRELASAADMQRLILPPTLPQHPAVPLRGAITGPAATPAATTTTCSPRRPTASA